MIVVAEAVKLAHELLDELRLHRQAVEDQTASLRKQALERLPSKDKI